LWSIWRGEIFTGELVSHQHAAAARVMQLLAGDNALKCFASYNARELSE
jgi:hypothetical protein